MDPLQSSSHRAVFPPLNEDIKRPLWSVVIPTHHCAAYLEETLLSVLKQDPGEDLMEIIVTDDHSVMDDPEAVVKKFGNRKITFIRQSRNAGKAANYASGIAASRGHLIHLLHGDDRVETRFYTKMQELLERFPEAGAAFCQCRYIDAKGNVQGFTGKEQDSAGILENWTERIATVQRIQPPSLVVKRMVYETLGGYDSRLRYMEDWEMYVRISIHFPFAFHPEVLASYRVHQQSSSQSSVYKGGRLATLRQVLAICDHHLPEAVKKKIKKPRNRAQAYNLVRTLPALLRAGDRKGYFLSLQQIARFTIHPRVWYHVIYFSLHYQSNL